MCLTQRNLLHSHEEAEVGPQPCGYYIHVRSDTSFQGKI